MDSELHDSDPNIKKSLQLFHRTDKYATMIITEIDVSGGGVRDKVQMFVFFPFWTIPQFAYNRL
jgi:hypothetical protein